MANDPSASATWAEIFPPERNIRWVQTEWSAGWIAAAHGFGRAAEFLTEHRADFHAEIDQAGLAIFYLQRHRVELLIKAFLDSLHAPVPTTHALDALWTVLKATVRQFDHKTEEYLSNEADEVILVLNAVDKSSMNFRYPVDKQGESSSRPDYINLPALQRHVERLDQVLTGANDYLCELLSAGPEF